MIDEFTADGCGKSFCPIADLHPFARWRKAESSILRDNRRAVVGNRRRLIGDPGLIKILSDRVNDPFALLVGTKPEAPDRRFRRDRSIVFLNE